VAALNRAPVNADLLSTVTFSTWGLMLCQLIWPPLFAMAPDRDAKTGMAEVLAEPAKIPEFRTTLSPLGLLNSIENGLGVPLARAKLARLSAIRILGILGILGKDRIMA
jgi:hypothetical protein